MTRSPSTTRAPDGTDTTGRTPPRVVIRFFWMLHRALVRVTGGRIGLREPVSGQRMGMMRLTTVGRRSGQERVAILGFFEDGQDLVTMAMNGWADAEPAWWLNLQARPVATVDLGDGPRAVHARAAVAAERERLWARFADFPGWGDDLDGYAARRAGQTAVVVLEPVSPKEIDRATAA